MASTPVLIQKTHVEMFAYNNTHTTTAQTVFTGNTTNANLGSKVVSLTAVNSDVSARTIRLSILRGGTSFYIGTVSVPSNSGYDGVNNAVDMLNRTSLPSLPVDNDGQPYLFLANGDVLQMSSTAQLTNTTTFVYITAIGGDF